MISLYKIKTKYSITKFPNWIKVDGKIYTNEASIPYAITDGWKELLIEEQPECDEETEYIVPYYEEEEKIIQKWEIREIGGE